MYVRTARAWEKNCVACVILDCKILFDKQESTSDLLPFIRREQGTRRSELVVIQSNGN